MSHRLAAAAAAAAESRYVNALKSDSRLIIHLFKDTRDLHVVRCAFLAELRIAA